MHHIYICLGSSCFSRGNNVHLEIIRQYIAENHLEAEIKFSFPDKPYAAKDFAQN